MMTMIAPKHVRQFHVSLPSEFGVEKLVRDALARLLPRWGLEAARIADFQTAVSEACINAIEHGNRGQVGTRLQVTLLLSPDHVDAVVADDAIVPFSEPEPLPPTIEQKLAGVAPARRMGLFLIRQLVDEAGFLPRESGVGNRFHLRIYRNGARGQVEV